MGLVSSGLESIRLNKETHRPVVEGVVESTLGGLQVQKRNILIKIHIKTK